MRRIGRPPEIDYGLRAGSDEAEVVRETRVFGTATSELLEMLDWLGQCGCTIVAMEATGVYWKPVWHVLEGHFELVLAQPAHVKNMPGS